MTTTPIAPHGSRIVLAASIAALALVGSACTRDGTGLAGSATTSATAVTTAAGSSLAPTPTSTTPATSNAAVATTLAPAPSTLSVAPTSGAPIATVPDGGVPGITDDDPFCAAWSRFGGSFSIVAPIAAFGDDAIQAEMLAAPTMVAAFDAMIANWPEEIVAYRARVEFESLGPLDARMNRNLERLRDAGATDEVLAAIDTAWIDLLATYDPSAAGVDLQLDGNAGALFEAAVAANEAAEQPFSTDPALITDPVPQFYDYLAANCPDQGTLAGRDNVQDQP